VGQTPSTRYRWASKRRRMALPVTRIALDGQAGLPDFHALLGRERRQVMLGSLQRARLA
jgi:hypothetical protein